MTSKNQRYFLKIMLTMNSAKTEVTVNRPLRKFIIIEKSYNKGQLWLSALNDSEKKLKLEVKRNKKLATNDQCY